MAINVTKFLVANDLATIDFEATCDVGQTIDNIYLWDESTYKDPASKIDLTSLLASATNSEDIVITAANAGVSSLSGIYFLEIRTSNSEAIVVATVNLTQYYNVQAKLIANVDLSCLNCNTNFQNALLLDLYLEATKNALILGRFQDAIENLQNVIIASESEDCSECNNIEPVVSSAGNVVSVGVIDCILSIV